MQVLGISDYANVKSTRLDYMDSKVSFNFKSYTIGYDHVWI